jgi:hypothetical protein
MLTYPHFVELCIARHLIYIKLEAHARQVPRVAMT